MKHAVYKKEFSFNDLFYTSYDIFLKLLREITIIGLIFYLPLNIIFNYFESQQPVVEGVVQWNSVMLPLGLGVGTAIIGLIPAMAIVYLIKNTIDGKKAIDYSKAINLAWEQFGNAFSTSVIMVLMLIPLFLLLVVPGIIYAVYWGFFLYVLVLFDKTGKEALDFSKELVKEYWWRVFGYLFLISMIIAFINIMIELVVGVPFFFMDDTMIQGAISGTISNIIMMFTHIAGAMLCINLASIKKKL